MIHPGVGFVVSSVWTTKFEIEKGDAMVTADKAKRMSLALVPQVNALLLAMTYVQVKREKVDAIQRRVLAQGNYEYNPEMKSGLVGPVLDPETTYLMRDDHFADYHAKMQAIHLAAGFEDAAKGYCPALCAENLQVEAECNLISAAEEFFPGLTNDKLLCGTGKGDGLETRQKYIDLLIGLVTNFPGYVAPAI